MNAKKILMWVVLLLILFTAFFFWLLGGTIGIIMTVGTLFKIMFGIFMTGLISFWAGYWYHHHKAAVKAKKESVA